MSLNTSDFPDLPAVVMNADGSQRPLDKYDGPLLAAGNGPVQFHVIAKPAGSLCNLDCTYCFYRGKKTLPDGPGAEHMSDETLDLFIRRYIEGVTASEAIFTWQGGEPMLCGLDFFRKVVALQKKYARPGCRIENDLQTNGVLLDEEWCAFLQENNFLVGISIDGPREIHDKYRRCKRGRPTFEQVMRGLRLLRRFDVPFNTLTCVNRYNARRPIDIYRFLRDEAGSTWMQFTPVVEFKGFDRMPVHKFAAASQVGDGDPESRPDHPDSIVTGWSVDPDDWGYFLCRLFDLWERRDVGRIFVNQFETLVARHMDLPAQMCVYAEHCGKGVAVEHEGSVYSCDHFVYPEHLTGNLSCGSLRATVLSRPQVKFGYAKSETLPQYCRKCPYLSACWGECPKNRIVRTQDGEPGLNYLCRGLKTFFAHAEPKVKRIVTGLEKD